jgi:hypothetical protein
VHYAIDFFEGLSRSVTSIESFTDVVCVDCMDKLNQNAAGAFKNCRPRRTRRKRIRTSVLLS